MSDRIVLKSRLIARSRGRLSGRSKVVEFDRERRVLTKNGREVHRLTPHQMLALDLLVQRAPRVVKYSELQDALWAPHEFITSPQQRIREIIADLRAFLGDSASAPRFIENIPSVGYSFVGDIDAPAINAPLRITGDALAAPSDAATTVHEVPSSRYGILAVSAIGVLTVLVVALLHGIAAGPTPIPRIQLGRLFVRSTSEGREPTRIQLTDQPERLVISPDGKKLLAISINGRTLSIVNTAARTARTLTLSREAGSLAVSPKGRLYIGATSDGVMVVDLANERLQPGIIPTGGPVRDMAMTPDGEKLFLALEYSGLKRILTRTGRVDLLSDRICPEYVAVDRQGTRLYVAYQCSGPGGRPGHDSVEIFDVDKEASIGIVNGPPMVGGPLSVSPDGKLVLLDGRDACARPDDIDEDCPLIPSHLIHLLRPSDRRILRTFQFPVGDLTGFLDNVRFLTAGTPLSVVDASRYTTLEAWNNDARGMAAFDLERRKVYLASPQTKSILILEVENPECTLPSAGLVTYYPGDGTLDDAAGLATLASHGAVRFVPGRVGQAFFLGGDSYLSQPWTGRYAFLGQDSTIALYVKLAAIRGEAVLVATNNSQAGIRLLADRAGHFSFQSSPGGSVVTSKTVATPNKWYHVVLTKTDQEVTLFVNGQLEGRGSSPPRVNEYLVPMLFGARSSGRAEFRGWLDEIAFYSRALTPAEISEIYKLRESGPCKL